MKAPFFIRLSAVVGCALAAGPLRVHATEDAYHVWLRDTLSASYGVSGANWVFGESEAAKAALTWSSSQTHAVAIAVTGQPFGRAFRFRITERVANPWNRVMNINTQATIAKGDKLLLVFWIRNLSAERGNGQVAVLLEETAAPYTKSLHKELQPAPAWQLWMIPFEAVMDHPAGRARFQVNLGYLKQEVEIGGFALLNFRNRYRLSDLPQLVHDREYPGHEANAPWRQEARQRIAKFRMAPLTVRVVDRNGTPVPDARVAVQMRKPTFGFGTAVAVWTMLRGGADGLVYRQKLENVTGTGRTFNRAVLENALKWKSWENNSWPGSQSETAGVVAWLLDRGMRVRGHNLVWPGFKWLPADIEQHRNDPGYIRTRVENHIRTILRYPGVHGKLVEWDVLNEPVHVRDLANLFGSEEIYADWFKLAAAADSTTRLFINEYNILSSGGMALSAQEAYLSLIQRIEAGGGRIDGIGMQAHMGFPLTPPALVYDIIDTFAALGKTIAITEYDASNLEQDIAAAYLRDFLTAVYSHPAVTEFLMWGFWDGAHWKDNAPLFRRDWSLKPAGQAFFDLVFGEWWTQDSGRTDVNGAFAAQGHLGDYEIDVSALGEQHTRAAALARPGTEIQIQLEGIMTDLREGAGGAPRRFRLQQNYPNPFNPQTRIRYSLPQAGPVRIEIFDATGRHVETPFDGEQQAGWHQFVYDASARASGVFLYRVIAGAHARTRKMIYLR